MDCMVNSQCRTRMYTFPHPVQKNGNANKECTVNRIKETLIDNLFPKSVRVDARCPGTKIYVPLWVSVIVICNVKGPKLPHSIYDIKQNECLPSVMS